MRRSVPILGYQRIDSGIVWPGLDWKTIVLPVVIGAAMGLLAPITLLLPRLFSQSTLSRPHLGRQAIFHLAMAQDTFKVDVGRYPTTQEGLAALVTAPQSVAGWKGPYVKWAAGFRDTWGHPYVYRCTPGASTFHLLSVGPNGKEGTAADITDLSTPGETSNDQSR